MEGITLQRDPVARTRQSPHPRVPSRPTTSSSGNPSIITKSSNGSSHHLPARSPHTSHRYHHSTCADSSPVARPSSRLSREYHDDPRLPSAPVSSFLQERLQRERQVENDRSGRMTEDLAASTGDIRDRGPHSSPVRRSATAMGRRARADSGGESSKQKGLGVKEMEQTVSTLHKQNFDLKLELFHRRERQTALEERVQVLETENEEATELNESLLSELEKRDRAVEEAVNMIVKLEARVEELLREREMVRAVEADGTYRHMGERPEDNGAAMTPKLKPLPVARLGDEAKSLERMPSFLSEHDAQTENLRNVVLGNRRSMRHIRNISESSADPSEINRIMSPSLSVLSESSFISVYGASREEDKKTPTPHDSSGSEATYVEASPTPGRAASSNGWGAQSSATPSRAPKAMTKGDVSQSAQLRSLNDFIDAESPLQQLERNLSTIEDASGKSRQLAANSSQINVTSAPARPSRPQPQIRTKQEKRDALNKVLTIPLNNHKDLGTSHPLPPTPDTISTSTLQRYQNSSDSLRHPPSDSPEEDPSKPMLNQSRVPSSQPSSTTAVSSRREQPESTIEKQTIDFSRFDYSGQPKRPQSAGETISSRARANSWMSDSDDSDGGADAHSEASSFDYWMRESLKPNRSRPARPVTHNSHERSASPDLFSFPGDGHGWETDAIFGALRGNGFLGSPVAALKRDPLDEALATPQSAGFQRPLPSADQGPPAPSRRSSLHARTGSSSAAASFVVPANGKLRKSPVRPSGANGRTRSNSIDSAQVQPPQLSIQTESLAGNGKRSQYPPIAGQQPRGRGLGLNSLFRRSGSESLPQSAVEAAFAPASVQPPVRPAVPSGRMSVPPPASSPWPARPPFGIDDDLSSATPPPIMRNRAPTFDAEAPAPSTPGHQSMAQGPSTPTTVVNMSGGPTTPGSAQGQSGGMRKWLGLGKGGVKNRVG